MHIHSIVANTPAVKLFDFPVLKPADHQLGAFIQFFNYIDLNLRRAIEAFAHAKLLRGEAEEIPFSFRRALKQFDDRGQNEPSPSQARPAISMMTTFTHETGGSLVMSHF